MEFYQTLKKVNGNDLEEKIKQIIKKAKENVDILKEEQPSKQYSNYIVKELLHENISAKLINTDDLVLEFEYYFVLVPSLHGGYFLVDLSFSHFNKEKKELEYLSENGYQIINDEEINLYFKIIFKNQIDTNFTIDKIYYLSFDSLENV